MVIINCYKSICFLENIITTKKISLYKSVEPKIYYEYSNYLLKRGYSIKQFF